jgi:hypothetical protein
MTSKLDDYKELDEILIDSNTHYERVCQSCGYVWLGLHCPHDGYQNPCPNCAERPATLEIKEPYTVCGCNGTVDLDELRQSLILWHQTEKEKYAMEARIDELEHVDGYECYWTQIKDTPDIKTDIDIDERITQLSSQLTNKKKGTK